LGRLPHTTHAPPGQELVARPSAQCLPTLDVEIMRTQIVSSIKSLFLLLSRACRALGLAKFQARDGFISKKKLLADFPVSGSVLEIGPFDRPIMRGVHVKYFDVMDRLALIDRARACGRNQDGCPHIDYVSDRGDLSIITEEKFDSVISSHCIEHQPDLIRHFNQVFDILRPGGRYFVIVPDKRFVFDYYIPVTRASEVLAAHAEAREVHTAASVIAHHAETTHNIPMWHWMGFHLPLRSTPPYVERLQAALKLVSIENKDYIDVHGWFFTPNNFLGIVETLSQLGAIGFKIERVYGTPFGSNEFFAVLQKEPTANAAQ
jgi:SAM-dependent methyltransferase